MDDLISKISTGIDRSLFHQILENPDILFAIVSIEGTIRFLNQGLLHTLNYPLEAIEGNNYEPFVYPDDIIIARQLFDKVVKGKSFCDVEIRLLASDHGIRFMRIFGIPLLNTTGLMADFALIGYDITEKKNSEVLLKRSTRQLSILNMILTSAQEEKNLQDFLHKSFRLILDFVNFDGGGIYLIDPKNSVAELTYFIGLDEKFISKVQRVSIYDERYSSVLREGRYRIEPNYYDNVLTGQNESTTTIASIPLRSEKGIIGAMNVASLAPRAILQEDEQLFDIIGKIIGRAANHFQIQEDRERLLEESLRVSEMKSRLIGFVSHELISPLTPIYGWASLLHEYVEKGMDISTLLGKKEVDSIFNNADRLQRLIDDYLDLSRIETGNFVLDLAEHNIKDILRDVLEIVAVRAKEKEISVILECAERNFSFDKIRMEEVLTNILTNAVKYSPPRTHINIRGNCYNEGVQDYFIIQVKDEGYGFTAEELKDAIIPFGVAATRQDIKKNIKGTGLGLYLSRVIVERHGGTLILSSPGPNAGTTVEIRLPIRLCEKK